MLDISRKATAVKGRGNFNTVGCSQKNLNASRPSEHPPARGKMSKRLGEIIGCRYKVVPASSHRSTTANTSIRPFAHLQCSLLDNVSGFWPIDALEQVSCPEHQPIVQPCDHEVLLLVLLLLYV